jgi:DNA-binding SARP family transcriptional activator
MIQLDQSALFGPCERSLRLLGGWRLEDRGEEVTASAAMRRLMALLALRGPQHRGTVAAQLWPHSPQRQAAGSLRELLWRLSQSDPAAVDRHHDMLLLPSSTQVDVIRLLAGVRFLQCSALPDAEILPLLTAGELLPMWHDEWVETEREHLRQTQLHGLELLAGHHLVGRRPQNALQVALAAAIAEPLRETAHRTVVRAHLAMGNYSQAVAQYERYANHLDDELGVRPSREFADLLRQRTREAGGLVAIGA